MQRILIIGANRGLGLEFTAQYLAAGAEVLAACREPAKADKLSALEKTAKGRLAITAVDAANTQSVSALAETIGGRAFDLVIANAGIYGPPKQGSADVDFDGWMHTFSVNTLGPLRIAQIVHGALKAGTGKRFVAITSRMGSIGETSSGFIAYRSSKAALNMAMRVLSADWKKDGITTAVLHPGWVRTDMGGPNATLSPEESVTAMRKTIDGLGAEQSGGFFDYDGAPIGW